jgi:hypothetical protein
MASDTTFPQVLHTILEDVDPSIISWVSGGTAFAGTLSTVADFELIFQELRLPFPGMSCGSKSRWWEK